MTEQEERYSQTRCGFDWGPVTVERQMSHMGYVVLQVRTERGMVDIISTPTGLLRISDRKGNAKILDKDE